MIVMIRPISGFNRRRFKSLICFYEPPLYSRQPAFSTNRFCTASNVCYALIDLPLRSGCGDNVE